MTKENIVSVLDSPKFEFSGTDHTIENGRFAAHDLYVTSIKINTGTAAELIDRHDESLEKGNPLKLKFYSPRGMIMEAPIMRLGQIYPGESYDEIEVLVTLTLEQRWSLMPLSDDYSSNH